MELGTETLLVLVDNFLSSCPSIFDVSTT